MNRWVILSEVPEVGDPETEIAARTAAAAAAPGVWHCSAGIDLPGSTGGLGMAWDLTGDTDPAVALPDLPGRVDAVRLTPIASHLEPLPEPQRVKRTLLLTVRSGTPDEVVEQFESDLMAMPTHIAAIQSRSLSRITGDSRWTHAWEQEFADVDGLNGDYLLHPYHWTHVDRWFDPEIPTSIVKPDIAHLYRLAATPVLGA
ncbi:Dabb family protein [Nocardia crassostreae]|uniref:Dabb family protein n=1 Tax=Nocardia crassostreae TaxID=53428 RepID=UPI000837052C|nr:Dabb family protein [Nocardia crassostreae]